MYPLAPKKVLKEKMMMMKRIFRHFLISTEGATAIEYGLIAFFITLAIFLLLTSMGESVKSLFSKVASSFP